MRAFLRWKSTFLVLVFFYYFVACGIERIYQPMASTFGLCGPLNLSPRNVFKKQKKLCFFFYKISSPFSLYNSQESESNTYTKHLVCIIIYFFLMDSFFGVNVPSTHCTCGSVSLLNGHEGRQWRRILSTAAASCAAV